MTLLHNCPDEKYSIVIVLINLCKALDVIDRKVLINRLSSIGIWNENQSESMFKSEKFEDSLKSNNYKLPQESVLLGPVFLYWNHL